MTEFTFSFTGLINPVHQFTFSVTGLIKTTTELTHSATELTPIAVKKRGFWGGAGDEKCETGDRRMVHLRGCDASAQSGDGDALATISIQ
jgi:hypothetical protein